MRKMEAFFGAWKLSKKANYDEYLKAIGNSKELNNDVIKPIETIHQDGDYLVWTIKNSHYTRDMRFKLDEPFFEDTHDNRLCNSVISLKEGQVVLIQKWDGKKATIVYEVNGKNMIVMMKCDDVEAMRVYEKI